MTHSQDLTRVLEDAARNVTENSYKDIDLDVLFDSLIRHSNLAVASLFEFFDFRTDEVYTISQVNLLTRKKVRKPKPVFNKESEKALKDAEFVLEYYEQDDLRPEMLLVALSSAPNPPFVLARIFEEIDQEEFIKKIIEFINDEGDFAFQDQILEEPRSGKAEMEMFIENRILDQFAVNLNAKARNGEFDNLIEYDDTINKLATILCKKTKPNAILVGAAGAGKTAIIEMLARQIVSGNSPELLSNKIIYNVSLSSMVAGTQFRGQFEERLQRFVEEAKRYDNVILFIDEIHTLIGAGGTGSNKELEASNILKPALARGEISCIGATTTHEYISTIKQDSALDRRFEKVFVNLPSSYQMKEILPELIKFYSEFHCAEYDEEFSENILSFCERFMPNRSFPDKAVDVIDHCGAMAKVEFFKMPSSIKELKKDICDAQLEIVSAEQISAIEEKLNSLKKECSSWQEKCVEQGIQIGLTHLKDFFKTRRNILTDFETIQKTEAYLKENTFGKDETIKNLIRELKKESLKTKLAPTSVLLYSKLGCGKTFLNKKLAESIRANGGQVFEYNGIEFDNLVKITGERHSECLAQRVAMVPNAIVLVDDFDKIHAETEATFKQILKKGKLTINGEVVDFSNIVFVLFSSSNSDKTVGFGDSTGSAASVSADLKKDITIQLPIPEPTESVLSQILDLKITELQLNAQKLTEIDENIKREIIKESLNKEDKFSFIDGQINKKIIPLFL